MVNFSYNGTRNKELIKRNKQLFTLLPKTSGYEFIEISNADYNFKDEHRDQFISHSIAWLQKYHIQ